MKKNTETKSDSSDIHDNKKDKKYLSSEKATIDLPDVKDIPGQEHVRPPDMKEFTDITASSSDEEGKGLLNQDEDLDRNTNVTDTERELLERSSESMATKDDEQWRNSTLDNKDADGESLNEQNDYSGDDLDVPGSELDDANEEIGEEDEENNTYSPNADREEQ